MLTVSQLSKSYGGRTLFRGVSFHVKASDRIGLVGPNGSGKSTLFRLILGDLESDEGTVAFRNRVAVGYLPQEIEPSGHETVLELATTVSPEITTLRNTLRTQSPNSDAWHATQERLDEWRLYELEPKAQRILAGLAFRQSDFQRPTGTLSGGWIMRAHLARLLVQEPGLLMLDEPTNHLDIESLIWFQDYLRTYPGAILMISHDRELLNQLVGSIFEIAQARIIRYRGNYDAYVKQRAMRQEQQWAAYKNQQKEIAALQRFADRFRAKATKASQAQSKLKQIERMEKIEAPAAADRTIAFHWPQPLRTGLKVVTLTDVHQAYGTVLVYQGLNVSVERGQRTVLVGPNGSGKSTLLKLLAGAIPVQQGVRELGLHVKVGYYAQHRIDMLNAGRTVLEEVLDASHPVGEQIARSVLGSFLFRGDDVFKRVSVLSGGEKSRLALVKLLLNPPNFLLMDEPTTHLDMASIEALIGALRQYKGTLLFISHDVYFIRSIATTVLHIHAGRLTPFAGDYQYYLDRTKALSERGALTAGGQFAVGRLADSRLADARPVATLRSRESPPCSAKPATQGEEESLRSTSEPGGPTRKTQRRLEAEIRQACSKKRREHEKKRSSLEADIERFETRQKTLAAQLENPDTYTMPGKPMALNRELTQVVESLKILYAEWEQLAGSEEWKMVDG